MAVIKISAALASPDVLSFIVMVRVSVGRFNLQTLEVAEGRAKTLVIDAIKKLHHEATVGDVCKQTSLPLNQCNYLLNKVASETKADLVVSQAGQVTYKFHPGFEGHYFKNGLKIFLIGCGLAIFETSFFLLRISFGIMLTLSLLVIVLLLIAIVIAALFASDSGGDGGGGGDWGFFDVGWFDISSLGDAFAWSYTPAHQLRIEKAEENKGHFFLEVFSFLFGDGHPNPNLDQTRWQLVAQTIINNKGVVVAEELAPYIGSSRDEDVLPTLVRFNGRPEVSETGNIVYIFDDLKGKSAGKQELPLFLKENYWRFSQYPAHSNLFVTILAGLNLWGSWWLYKHIATINLLHHFAYLIDALLVYALLFCLLPFVRLMFIGFANGYVEQRNLRAQDYSDALRFPKNDLKEKLDQAKSIRFEIAAEKPLDNRVIYTTEKDALEQEFSN